MQYAAWFAHMYTPNADGVFGKDAYEQILTMPRHHRRAEAERMLAGPRMPETVANVFKWAIQLRRGAGLASMGGPAPLSWNMLDPWSRYTGNEPSEEEIDLLFAVDAALRNPPEAFTLNDDDDA